jgi:hypothetical protein
MKSAPVPGERSTEWLQRAREDFTVAVNPMPAANLIPGRRPAPYEDAFVVRKRMLGMERELAKKWSK